ncbi:MAG: type II toxin-antitoxin system HicA family toxin [Acaryochloris sp. RU_4_1]|nr:type II toxin-antitoxin system HicA family toxin [Acaryochloris sp. RU_4_1]NJR56953.1 type II toxin-antitoxin system HicA family toxin [Acaryochloris sp. CRU_2_0]
MSAFGPIKRSELIQRLKRLGFDGPYAGGKHEFMVKDSLKIRIPNPHRGDISKGLLAEILRQANITREEWERL